MPRILHETTDDRKAEIDRREARARAAVAAVPRPPVPLRLSPTPVQARAWASKCGLPNTEVDAEREEGRPGWISVVCIRPDQEWMRAIAVGRGCRVRVLT